MSQYRPLGLVGQGQYGQVYFAYSPVTRGLVALKALNSQRFPTRNFLRELRFLVGLNHPQIVRCHTLDYWQGRRCLVMDYGEGGTLRGLLEQEEHLPIRLGLELAAEILAGLQYIHGQGIIHCDIKPENILLRLTRRSWRAQISDLGVARIEAELESGGQTGSPAYMAPERFYGQYLPASDVYAVGVLLFEMITGDRPFHGSPVELMSSHLSQAVEISPGLPFLVQSLLRKSLAKLPQRRYQSAAEMAQAVQLAHDVLLAEGKQFYPLFPKSNLWFSAWQPRQTYGLQQPISQLVTLGEKVFGLSADDITEFSSGIGSGVRLQHPAPIKQLWPGQHTYWYQDRDGRVYQAGQSVPILAVESDSPLVIGIEAQGKWLVQARQDLATPLKIIHLASQNEFYGQLPPPTAEPVHLQQLLGINPRYGLAVVESIAGDTSHFYLFNRRAQILLTTGLPLRFRQLTQAWHNPWHFAALSPDQPQAVLLIRLKPWLVQRIILSFQPRWLTATPWGYALANQDTVACIAESGELLGGIALPTPLTALAGASETGLWLASWDGEAGQLMQVEFSQMGLDLIL